MNFQPVIKWTGSKRSQSEQIVLRLPKSKYNTYYEPFCGGCSVLFQLLNSDVKFNNYVCSDINNDLISLWNLIKNDPQKVINHYTELWTELNKDNDLIRKNNYYRKIRSRFNKSRNPCDFMFIMRTAVNGMPRYNSSNEFNTGFHITRNGIKPEKLDKIVKQWSLLLNKHNVQFLTKDYRDIIIEKDDFLYIDPPYSNTKGIYYGVIDYDELWNYLRKQKCDYIFSFNNKTHIIYDIPKDVYDKQEYLYSGNSSFRRISKKRIKEFVSEGLYIKNNNE